MKSRIETIQKIIAKQGATSMLVTRLSNVRYLCGYSGSAGALLITKKQAFFFSDFRYRTQAAAEVTGAEVIIYPSTLWKELAENKNIKPGAKLLVESGFLTLDQATELKNVWSNTELIPSSNLVERPMAIKDESELALHKKAVAITDKVFQHILGIIKPGVRELDIALEISYMHRKFGADGDSFEPIVASGWRGALPHGRASEKKIKNGELVTLDFGCYYQGYASDLTRTIAVGKLNAKQELIYNTVYKAQTAAVKAAKPGMTGKELDAVARDIINAAGFGENFGHGLGHGLGIDVHSWPRVNQLGTDKLLENMVFTIEPGIYVEGFGGVRIEDDVWLTSTGAKVLNKSPKTLIRL